MSGPPPKPTKLRILNGNPSRRPLNENEPEPTTTGTECPTWIDSYARREWKRVVPELHRLGLLTLFDVADLAGYCQAVSDIRRLGAFVRKHGETMETSFGQVMMRPETRRLDAAWARLRAFATEFGFSPASRSRITVGSPKADTLDDLLG